ncbi:MAG: pseudaminic acid synthase [Halobacteriovorax sp.]|nr:pseudaminic acid synthase [Halobacteriovorax sp.]|tara:strand:- start:6393 stop:7454 length:1062 start_codon:yes stop_codon:yes gene_type:complete
MFFNEEISIGNIKVGKGHKPFIVAEMSGNHNQSIERAYEIIDAAAEAGAHAVKLQTYTPDTITLNIKSEDFTIGESLELWKGKSLYELYGEAYTPWEWHKELFERCKEKGMLCFSSPFDHTAVDFLEELDVPAYKIASFECNDIPLIKKVARTGKPIIISTGMASVGEIDDAVNAVKSEGNKNLILLKCTSTYPADPADSNIKTISHLSKLFDVPVGLSDHTLGVGVPLSAIALGAVMIEKHFTLSRDDGGVDSAFSLEPHELRSLVVESERSWKSLGVVRYGHTNKEAPSLNLRRSLYVCKGLKKGEKLTPENLRSVRPALGVEPKFYEQLLDRTVNRDIEAGTPFKWEYLG